MFLLRVVFLPVAFTALCCLGGKAQELDMALYDSLLYTNPDSAYRLTQEYYLQGEYVKQDTGNLLNMMGGAAWVQGNLIEAANHFAEAIKWYEKKEATLHARLLKLNLGNVFNDLGAYSLAERYYRESITEDDQSDVMNNIGTVKQRKGESDSAEYYLKRGLELYKADSNEHGVMLSTANLAHLYVEMKKYDTALLYLEKALFLTDSLNDLKMLSTTLNAEANFYLGKKNHAKALAVAHRAKAIADKGQFREASSDAALTLSKIYKDLNRNDSALFYLERANVLDDSLKKSSDSDISSLITSFYEEKSAREKALIELEIVTLRSKVTEEKNFRNLIIFLALLVITGGFISWRFMQLRVKRQKLSMALQAEQAEKVKDRLHFKEKELLTLTLKEAEVQSLLQQLKNELNSGYGNDISIKRITSLLKSNMAKNNQWEEFKTRFESIHESFFNKLLSKHPGLSPKELKLSALAFLNLSAKEIGDIQGIKSSSVDIARHRLRKKLNVPEEQSLIEYLRSFA